MYKHFSKPRSRAMRIEAFIVFNFAFCVASDPSFGNTSPIYRDTSPSKQYSSDSDKASVENGHWIRDSSRSDCSDDTDAGSFRIKRKDGRYNVYMRLDYTGPPSLENEDDHGSGRDSRDESALSDGHDKRIDGQVSTPRSGDDEALVSDQVHGISSDIPAKHKHMEAVVLDTELGERIFGLGLTDSEDESQGSGSSVHDEESELASSEKEYVDNNVFGNIHDIESESYPDYERHDFENPPVSCIDSHGNRVDWWIAYILRDNGQYVEYTSLTARENAGTPKVYGMNPERSFFVQETSPMLRTVYGNLSPETPLPLELEEESPESRNIKDTRMFFAWNDAQPGASSELHDQELDGDTSQQSANTAGSAGISSRPVNGDGNDMYNWGVDVGAAHSKGMVGLGFDGVRKEVSFYLLTHSFPKIPNGAEWHASLPVKRRRPPADPSVFFGTNITGPQSKAQHAMCLSMTQRVGVNSHGEIVFNAAAIDHNRQNLFALLDGLDVIHPAMVLTDYDPWAQRHRAYHQLFNVSSSWTQKRWEDSKVFANSNVARKKHSALQRAKHAFPLWPTANHVKVTGGEGRGMFNTSTFSYFGGGSLPLSSTGQRFRALRTSNQFQSTRCQKWDADAVSTAVGSRSVFDGRTLPVGAQCFLSVTLTTTGRHGRPLVIVGDYKHALAPADVDDILRRHVVSGVDNSRAAANATGSRRHNVSLVVVVQSWQDHGTQAPQRSTAINLLGYRVVVWFLNSSGSLLSKSDGSQYVQPASSDHAKWFVSYLYGRTGAYTGVAGVMDLNRNRKMTLLTSETHGRSGAVYTTCDPAVVHFFYTLPDEVNSNASFKQANLGISRLADTRRFVVERNNTAAQTMDVRFDVGYHASIRVPFINAIDVCEHKPYRDLQRNTCTST